MNITVPIYIKNGDLPNQAGKNTHLKLCHTFNQHVPDQTIGAQLVQGVWSIWIKDPRARDYMISTVKMIELAIVYNCICIDVFVDLLLMLINVYSLYNIQKLNISTIKLFYPVCVLTSFCHHFTIK